MTARRKELNTVNASAMPQRVRESASRGGPASVPFWRLALAFGWGAGGVVLLLLRSTVRLARQGIDLLRGQSMDALHWILLVVWLMLGFYTEGYRGFQKRFAPRVARRAQWLATRGSALDLALGPVFCMAYVRARRGRMITSWIVTLMIVGVVVAVRQLPPMWHGIVDLGVAFPLAWGAGCVVAMIWRWRDRTPTAEEIDLPRDEARTEIQDRPGTEITET